MQENSKYERVVEAVMVMFLIIYAFYLLFANLYYGLPYMITQADAPPKVVYFSNLLAEGLKEGSKSGYDWTNGFVALDYYVYIALRWLTSNFHGLIYHGFSCKGGWCKAEFLRFMGAVYGLIAVVMVLVIAKKLFKNMWVGLLAGFMLVNNPQFVMYSHNIMGPVPTVVFSLLAFLFILKSVESKSVLDYAMIGLFGGIGAGCEYYAVFILIVAIFVHFLKNRINFRSVFDYRLGILFFFALIGFGIATPYFFFFPGDMFSRMFSIIRMVFRRIGFAIFSLHISVAFAAGHQKLLSHASFLVYWQGLRDFALCLQGMGKGLDEHWKFYDYRFLVNYLYLGLYVFSGIVLFRDSRRDLAKKTLFLAGVIYVISFVLYTPRWIRPRETINVLPYVYLMVAYVIFKIYRWLKSSLNGRVIKLSAAILVTIAVLGPLTYDGLVTRYLFYLGETRELARIWWYNNIPPLSKVYMQTGAFPSFVNRGYRVVGCGIFPGCGLKGYIITDERVNYNEDIDRKLIEKCQYIPVKSFVTMFINMWNADVHVFKSDYVDILPAVAQPRFLYRGLGSSRVIFYDKRDVNQDEDVILCREWEVGRITVVSPEPVKRIGLLLYGIGKVAVKNGSFYKEVNLGVPWDVRKHKDRLLLVKPGRRYPFFKYFYEFEFETLSGKPFVVKVLTKKRDIAEYLIKFGRYREAVEILKEVVSNKNVTASDYVNLIQAYYNLKDYGHALNVWREAESHYGRFWGKVYELSLRSVNSSWLEEYEEKMRISPEWVHWNKCFYRIADFERIGMLGGRVVYPHEFENKVVEFTPSESGKWAKIWTQGYVNGGLFHKGWYKAYFFIKPVKSGVTADADARIGTVDVMHHFLWRFYGAGERKVIKVKDLKERWNLIELDFYAPLPIDGFELRFHYEGGIPVYFGGVKVVPDYRRTLLDMELKLYGALANSAKKLNKAELFKVFDGKVRELSAVLK